MYLNEQKSLGIINANVFLDSTTSLVLTGDWGDQFVVWIDAVAYPKLGDDDQAISCFKELRERCISAQVKGLEHFVCRVYSSKGPTTLPSLRWELFRSKNLEGKMLVLSPTHATLLLHDNYITMGDKSYQTNCPELPPTEENG